MFEGVILPLNWKQRKPAIEFDKYDNTYSKLAKLHGISNIDQFLNPLSNVICDSYLLKNINELATRIILAIRNREPITITGDPD
jgi:single-stranded-DNA-specific exonuclease